MFEGNKSHFVYFYRISNQEIKNMLNYSKHQSDSVVLDFFKNHKTCTNSHQSHCIKCHGTFLVSKSHTVKGNFKKGALAMSLISVLEKINI